MKWTPEEDNDIRLFLSLHISLDKMSLLLINRTPTQIYHRHFVLLCTDRLFLPIIYPKPSTVANPRPWSSEELMRARILYGLLVPVKDINKALGRSSVGVYFSYYKMATLKGSDDRAKLSHDEAPIKRKCLDCRGPFIASGRYNFICPVCTPRHETTRQDLEVHNAITR